MKKVEIFEPALCCPTGLCGPTVDQNLVRLTAIQRSVNHSGKAMIVRRNLAQNPNAFVRNKQVAELLKTDDMACLPITLVDGVVKKTGAYPTNEELIGYTGVATEQVKTQ
ncbi:arsenite efflux transporter metallochaperone ArsD [Secundilactobacillus mixtipabuli]|uniref:Arsenic resistance operon repressor n=1 Tax=Secundilactobacillus mixtipabuli TaxID=1435342 RepID=A0A1Z5I8Q7_9LACO|nr:arsenite efflux transporter metallochaperone ArsD [Secundilactobacillus mixtipabuli]GAW98163.1 arsenic resistance operon repressor [Secundilactobacillus mixtipabuli]